MKYFEKNPTADGIVIRVMTSEHLVDVIGDNSKLNLQDIKMSPFKHYYIDKNDFSTVYEQYFENWDVKNDDGVITISLNQKKVGNGTGIDRAVVNEGTVSIILPFKVLDSNAKSKSGNTYTWNINSFKGKKIYIKFDSKHLEKSSYNNIVPIFIFSLLAIAVVIIIVIFLKRKNNSNSF